MFDIVINNGYVIDGTGSEGFWGNVGITGNKIVKISEHPLEGKKEIDAKGLIVAPGFVDVHSHYDFVPFIDYHLKEKIGQGITTMLVGLCGLSAQPVFPDKIDLVDKYVGFNRSGAEVDYNWQTTKGYLEAISENGLGINVATLVGHGTLRINIMGFEDRQPNQDEMEKMEALLDQCLSEGAFGMSLGLIYPPGVFSGQEEFISLAKVLQKHDCVLATHMRNESDHVLESIQESIDIARQTGVSLQIHHLKAIGARNWGKGEKAIALIEEANKEGLHVCADQYHYTYGCGPLRTLLPPWVHEGGVSKIMERLSDEAQCQKIKEQIQTDFSYENLYLHSGGDGKGVTVLYAPDTPEYVGKTLYEIGKMLEVTPLDAAFYVIRKNEGKDKAAFEIGSEKDIEDIIKSEFVMIGSDANRPAKGAMCHPRTYGEFARVYAKYARNQVITLEQAVKKMTSMPCEKYGFTNKGKLLEGYDADITIFNFDQIQDCADLQNTTLLPKGIAYVIVNGEMAMNQGIFTDSLSGKVLKKQ